MIIINSLLLAWFLTWFDFDKIVIEAVNELFGKSISTSTYYFFFFVIGLIGDIVIFIKNL